MTASRNWDSSKSRERQAKVLGEFMKPLDPKIPPPKRSSLTGGFAHTSPDDGSYGLKAALASSNRARKKVPISLSDGKGGAITKR